MRRLSTAGAMALPITEKVALAQALWQSPSVGLPESDEQGAVRDAVRRDKELSTGKVAGLGHGDAMKTAVVRSDAGNSHPEATAEPIEAGRFYEQKVPSLG